MTSPLVLILMGSESDKEVMRETTKTLDEFNVGYELHVASAHRTPDKVRKLVTEFEGQGGKVIIAGAGMAAHLAGAVAAQTTLPVIGVPIGSSPLGGLDALLSTVQMPPGIPVATVAIGVAGARNAGVLAVQMLALADRELAAKLKAQREALHRS